MFGVPSVKEGSFNIYHDESGTDLAHDRYQLHGILTVPEHKMDIAFSTLHEARNDYEGRVHFVNLRDNSSSKKSEVARNWINYFFKDLSDYCFYKCSIVDTHSPNFPPQILQTPHFLYNYTAMLGVYGNVTWSMFNYKRVNLSIYSETLCRKANDNFETYLPKEVTKRAKKNKKCPDVFVIGDKVTLVDGDPGRVEANHFQHCEFIQLTDVLTGAVNQAINMKAQAKIKLDLGKFLSDYIGDTRLPPWLQENGLHRKFSVSCQDGSGKFYDVVLKIQSKGQMKLDLPEPFFKDDNN